MLFLYKWAKGHIIKRMEGERKSIPCDEIQTHDLSVTRCVLYRCVAATALTSVSCTMLYSAADVPQTEIKAFLAVGAIEQDLPYWH